MGLFGLSLSAPMKGSLSAYYDILDNTNTTMLLILWQKIEEGPLLFQYDCEEHVWPT